MNKESFVGMFPGTFPSKGLRQEYSQMRSLKLYKASNTLSGTIVALAASEREYAYPYYIKLEKQ